MKMVAFNVDQNVRQADYKDVPPGHLRLTKIFRTIQGEGPYAGMRAVFVRTAGCNLGDKSSCPWCDSDFRMANGQNVSFEEIETIVNGYLKDDPFRLVVLTGGEPLLQPQMPEFLRWVRKNSGDWRIQVETNGYFWNEDLSELAHSSSGIVVVVSPKVNARKVYPPLDKLLIADMRALKILVDADSASPYHVLPPYTQTVLNDCGEVYLSPITIYGRAPDPNHAVTSIWPPTPIDPERTRRNYAYAAELVMKTPGTRLSLQTHLFAAVE